MKFIIKLFPEITIKSKPVRRRFIQQLASNLRKLIKPVDDGAYVVAEWDRIHVIVTEPASQDSIVTLLSHTPGISNFQRVTEQPFGTLDDILAISSTRFAPLLKPNSSFAVRCRRYGTHTFSSQDVERNLGGALLAQCPTTRVNLTTPDLMVRVEVRFDSLYLVENSWPGLGGYPLGTQDAVLSLMSGGFDSTVASYLTMKRGLLTHFCFFNLGGKAHEFGVQEVAVYLWMKYGASHRVQFVSVPFEEVLAEILEKIDNSQMGVVLKRMMLRAATVVAEEMHIPALVTGESVAQVSSQTLTNLSVISAVTDMLLIRPLITMDKVDIIRIARDIGTEAFANTMPEYCGAISKKPTTRAKIARVESEELLFDNAVLDRALATRRAINIDNIVWELARQNNDTPETVNAPLPNDVIVDIRHPDDEEHLPLILPAGVIIEKIPFYALHKRFVTLDSNKRYLLYCDKGVMSNLHAQYLRGEGYSNVAVLHA